MGRPRLLTRIMTPRDVYVLLALNTFDKRPTYAALADMADMVPSQVYGAVKFLKKARLVTEDGVVNKTNFREFVQHGLPAVLISIPGKKR